MSLNQNKKTVSFEDAVSLTGFGYYNFFIILTNGGCLLCVILETMGMMFIMPAAKCDLQLDLNMQGYLSGASFLGVVTGSHFWGFLGDTRGRKRVILTSLLTSFLVTLISSLVYKDWLFILCRYLNGLFIGGCSGIIYAYAGEFHNNNYRPKVVSWISGFVGIANIVMPAVAWIILRGQWTYKIPFLEIDFKPWRLLVISYGIPSLIFAIFVYMLPESPKYLLMEGKKEEVLNILKNMHIINNKKSKSQFDIDGISCDENSCNNQTRKNFFNSIWNQTIPLIKRRFIFKTIMICMLQFGIFASTAGIIMWYPEVFNRMTIYETNFPEKPTSFCKALQYHNLTLNNDETLTKISLICNDVININVFLTTLSIGAFLVFIYYILGSLVNLISKKYILFALFIMSSIAGIIAQYIEGDLFIKILMGLAQISSTSVGIVTAVVVDLYPTQLRAMALAVSFMFGRTGAVVGSHIFGYIFHHLCNYTFIIFTSSHIVLITLVFLLLQAPRTPQIIEIVS